MFTPKVIICFILHIISYFCKVTTRFYSNACIWIEMFNKNYELILSNVRKMSCEVHDLANKESVAIKLIKKLRDDPKVELKIVSIDGVDITESFWICCGEDHHDWYREAIVSLKVL